MKIIPARSRPLLAVLGLVLALFAAPIALRAQDSANWHPGHYMYGGHGGKLTPTTVAPVFRGIQLKYLWRDLEPEFDRYDGTQIDHDLAALAEQNAREPNAPGGVKRLFIQIQFKSFGRGASACPAYLETPEYGGGVYVKRGGASDPVIWNERLRARLEGFIRWVARTYRDHPLVEGFNLPESIATLPPGGWRELQEGGPQATVQDYDASAAAVTVAHNMAVLRAETPAKVTIAYVNFGDLVSHYAEAHRVGIGIGGPDVYVKSRALLNQPQPKGAYAFYPEFSTLAPIGPAVQGLDYMSQGDAFNDFGVLPEPQEIFEFARDSLKANYLFWDVVNVNATVTRRTIEMVTGAIAPPSNLNGQLNAQRPQSLPAAPDAPVWPTRTVELKGTADGTTVILIWPQAKGATGYEVERKVVTVVKNAAGASVPRTTLSYERIGTTKGGDATSYTDAVTPGSTQHYLVRAVNAAGFHSSYTRQAIVTASVQ